MDPKQPIKTEIKSKNNVDIHAIKIENEQERNVQKNTQKEMAQKLRVQYYMFVAIGKW
jgi:hypothetical protein